MSILSDVRGLFYPSLCPVCGGELPEGGRTVCTLCRMTAPLTRFWEQADNPMMRRLWGHVPVVGAAAFIWYVEGSGWQRLIHAFKYHGQWRLALEMGTWYGACLADSGAFADADALVPVHWTSPCGRGFCGVGGTTPAKPVRGRPTAGATCKTSLRSADRKGWPDVISCSWTTYSPPVRRWSPARRRSSQPCPTAGSA